jgi:hypothetical protein
LGVDIGLFGGQFPEVLGHIGGGVQEVDHDLEDIGGQVPVFLLLFSGVIIFSFLNKARHTCIFFGFFFLIGLFLGSLDLSRVFGVYLCYGSFGGSGF